MTVLNRYEIFLEVMRTQNMSKTAQNTHQTTSSVSYTIAKLEDELGVQLLSRNHSKITPTEAAKKLLPLIQEVVDADRRVMEFADMIRSDRVGAVRIGGLRAASMRWIPGILRKMQAVAPGISVQPTMNRYEETIGDLLEGRVDVAFCEEPANRDLIYMRVIDDPYMVILPEHHSLASSGQLGLSDLKGKTLIIPEWPMEDNFGDVETAKKLRDMVSYRIQDERTIIAMVQNGLGLAVMPGLLVPDGCKGVCMLPFREFTPKVIGLVYPRAKQNVYAVKKFVQTAFEYFAEIGIS